MIFVLILSCFYTFLFLHFSVLSLFYCFSLVVLFDEFIKNNPDSTYDDFLNSMKLKRISLKGGGLSIDVLLDMMKNEYPKEYNRLLNKYKESISIPKEDLLEAFKNLDKDGVPFEQGGLVSNYKKDLRKP